MNKYFNLNGYKLTAAQTVITTSQLDELFETAKSSDDVSIIGKIKFYVDLYTECASMLNDENRINEYQTILRDLQDVHDLTDDDMSDLFNDYFNDFMETVETVLNNYRENHDYNNPDDFIETMYEFDNLDNIEQQLINDIYLSTIN